MSAAMLPVRPRSRSSALSRFARSQAVNASRNAAALKPFAKDEFGTSAASPSPAHIEATNKLIVDLQSQLQVHVAKLADYAANVESSEDALDSLLKQKELTEKKIKFVEGVWSFYFDLFNERKTRFADALLAVDRISLDCYQAVYTRLGKARSIPSPPPFSFVESKRTPSTFRRGVKMSKLGKRANPFPIVQLPLHRLINPWTLGAVHHEVAHNLQSDLGMWEIVPKRIGTTLQKAQLPPEVVATWQRWHKETWADLCGLLLGGPAMVISLFDVLARSARKAQTFISRSVHPTPYIRALVNLELLNRMGFKSQSRELAALWRQLYPDAMPAGIPRDLIETLPQTTKLVVQTICFDPYPQLGGKSLINMVTFTKSHQLMVQEAAQRIAAGNDPGIIPERFLVAAARKALEKRYASPKVIRHNFYKALVRR